MEGKIDPDVIVGYDWERFGREEFPPLIESLLLPSKTEGVLRPLDDVLSVMEDRFEEAEAALDGIEQQAAEGKCAKTVSGFSTFLSLHLPCFTEGLYRRDVRALEDVARVQAYIRRLLVLMARLVEYDVEEVLLILHVLLGGVLAPTFTTFCPKGHVYNDGFYIYHGRAQCKSVGGRLVYFWPEGVDGECTVKRGHRAVGRRVDIVLPDEPQPLSGLVIDYREEGDEHLVTLDKDEAQHWVRLEDRTCRWLTKEGPQHGPMECLRFSKDDIGARLKVYWAKDRVYYKGIVSEVKEEGGPVVHTVLYDDGDVRSYDMTTRDYQLLTAPIHSAGGGAALSPSKVRPQTRVYCRRPPPAQSHVSAYLLSNVNYFGQLGGFDAMSRRLYEAAAAPAVHSDDDGEGSTQEDKDVPLQEQDAAPPKRPLPLACVRTYVQMLHYLRARLEPEVLDGLVWDLKETLPSILLHATDDEQLKQLGKPDLRDLMAMVTDLLTLPAPSRNAAATCVEALQLGLACRLLRTSTLEKRLLGLTLIREAISRCSTTTTTTSATQSVVRREGTWSQNASSFAPRLSGRGAGGGGAALDESFVLKWLVQSAVVEELFGARMHMELVPRSEDMIKFLAARGAITQHHLHAIWNCTLGKHEAVLRVLYAFIVDLVPHLTPPLRLFLFSRIAALPFHRYDHHTLQIVYDFTINALQAQRQASQPPATQAPLPPQPPPLPTHERSGSEDGATNGNGGGAAGGGSLRKGQVAHSPERQWYGFGVLWRYLQDDRDRDEGSTLSVELTAKAVTLLVQLLGEKECGCEREALLTKCVDNIRQHRSVPSSLLLMTHTLNTYPSGNKSWLFAPRSKDVTVSSVIEMLEKSHGLLSLLFADLSHLHTTLRSTYLPPARPIPSEAFNEKRPRLGTIRSRYSYLQHLQARLDFLTFLLAHSPHRLDMGQLDTLWTVYVEQGLTARAGDLLVEWIAQLAQPHNPDGGPITPDPTPASPVASSPLPPPPILEASGAVGSQEAVLLGDGLLHALFHKKIPSLPIPQLRPAVARLYLQLFLYVNGRSKALRKAEGVESGGWVRHGARLEGVDPLWEMALDARDERVSSSAMSLLIELHHRFSQKLKSKAEELRGSLVSTCLSKIEQALPALSRKDPTTQTQLASQRVCRSIQMLTLFLERFKPGNGGIASVAGQAGAGERGAVTHVDIIIQAGRTEATALELRLPASSTVRLVREKVAAHFNEATSSVLLFKKPSAKVGVVGERVDRDGNSLEEEGWAETQAVVLLAKKNDKAPSGAQAPATGAKADGTDNPAPTNNDLIKPRDLEEDATGFNVMEAQSWLWEGWGEGTSGTGALPPTPPLPHKPDMTFHKQNGPPPDMPLFGHFKQHPEQLDQLLALLELDHEVLRLLGRADLQPSLWELVQSLPSHPSILQTLRSMSQSPRHAWQDMFSQRSVYRLLYRLQILDAFMTTTAPCAALTEWQQSFIQHGGIQSLAGALHDITQLARQLPTTTTSAANFGAVRLGDGLPSSETVCVTIALLARLLHAFLNLHPPGSPDRPPAASLNLSQPLAECLDALFCLAKARQKPSPSNLLSALQHVLLLVKGCAARREGLALKDYPRLPQWVAAFTLKVPSEDVRRAVASSLLQIAEAELQPTSPPDPRSGPRVVGRMHEGSGRPVVVPLLLTLLLDRLEQGAEVFDAHRHTGPSRPARSLALGGLLNGASISSSHEYFALLAAILQLALRPLPTLQRNHALRLRAAGIEEARAEEGEEEDSVRQEEPKPKKGQEEDGEEQDKRLATWGIDLLSLCARVGSLIGRCRPALWLSEARAADETFGGLIRVAVVLAEGSVPRRLALGAPGRAQMQWLYSTFLFQHLTHDHDEAAAAETLGAMYVSTICRSLLYRLLVGLCRNVPSHCLALLRAMSTANEAKAIRGTGRPQLAAAGEGGGSGPKAQQEGGKPSQPRPSTSPSRPAKAHRELSDEAVAALYAENRAALACMPLRQVKWDYDPDSQLRDPRMHVGLKNQGATCYMNSLLQQLYHIPEFRTGILGIEAKETEDAELHKSVLFQLQALFAFLQTSEKKSCDTLSFCRTLTDYSGEPLRLQEQKDVNEFCNMLFDKLESLDPRLDKLLKGLFGGVQINQIISRECPHRSERSEPFTMLTADMKNKHSLEEALQLYVSGEVLAGDNKYHCSECDAKVDALRRTALSTLPPVLIIHLKRFEFNLETMTKFKVNDRCSFPMLLDMAPFTVDYLARKESATNGNLALTGRLEEEGEGGGGGGAALMMSRSGSLRSGEAGAAERARSLGSTDSMGVWQGGPAAEELGYELRGVVAHVGTADSGHYYSFIRSRGGRGAERQWFEYNDQLVLPFEEGNIPKECFGGVEPIMAGAVKDAAPSQQQRVRNNNAYLLFYERTNHPPHQQTVRGPSPPPTPGEPDVSQTSQPRTPAPEGPDEGSVFQRMGSETEGVITTTLTPPPSPPRVVKEVNSPARNGQPMDRRYDRSDSISAFVSSEGPGGSSLAARSMRPGGVPLPPSVRREVWRENMTFFRDKHLFARAYARFLWQLLHTQEDAGVEGEEGEAMRVAALSVGLRFLVQVLVRARAASCVPLWCTLLRGLIAKDREFPDRKPAATMALSFMADEPDGREALIQVLMVCPNAGSRKEFVSLLVEAVKELRALEAGAYLATIDGPPPTESTGHGPVVLRSGVGRLVAWVLTLLELSAGPEEVNGAPPPRHPPLLPPYAALTPEPLRLLASIAEMGPPERRLLKGLGAVHRLSLLVMSFSGGGDNRSLLQTAAGEEAIALAIRVLSTLVVSDGEGGGPPLRRQEMESLGHRRFVEMAAQTQPTEAARILRAVMQSATDPHQQPSDEALCVEMVDVLVERAIEATNLPQGGAQAVATRLSFRPFLTVLQALLTWRTEGRTGDRQQDARLQAALPLAERCHRLSHRRTSLDLDFIHAVTRLFLSASLTSPSAAVFVAQRVVPLLGEWRRQLSAAFHSPPPPNLDAQPRV